MPLGFWPLSAGNPDTSYTSVSVLLMPALHQKVQAVDNSSALDRAVEIGCELVV